MRKKASLMKLPSLFKTKEEEPQHHRRKHHHQNVLPWQNLFLSCSNYPKTLSFRGGEGDFFKTVNSVFFDPAAIEAITTTDTPSAESWITTTTSSSESASAVSLSTESEEYYRYCNEDGESLEMVVRGVKRSERLLFEAEDTSSILEKAKGSSSLPFKESVVVAMESEDPYSDFKRSMEEMVECHGVKDDWEGLEELLCWYLKVNGKNNHGFIVSAFVDLLVTIAVEASKNNSTNSSSSTSSSSSSSSDSTIITTYSSALSSFSSTSPLCLSQGHNENVHHNQHPNDSTTT